MWAQRAIAHIKCIKILELKRLYCRQAILSHKNPNYYNFKPEFDLTAIVQKIAELRANQTVEKVDDYKPLTYEQTITGLYVKQWKKTMDRQINSFTTIHT